MSTKSKKEESKIETKQLYRSETDKVIAGVAGGLGEYFNIDATIIRVIFILLAVYGGSGIFIYLVLWLLIPKKSQVRDNTNKTINDNFVEMKQTARNLTKENNSRQIIGFFLLLFGILFLLDNFNLVNISAIWRFWPVVLIIGGYLILSRHGKS